MSQGFIISFYLFKYYFIFIYLIPFFCQMVTVNSLQAIYKLLCASPDTSTLGKQLNAQLINVRTVTALLQIANNAQVEYTYIGETGHFLSPGNSTLMTLLIFDIRSHLLGFGSKWGKSGALLFSHCLFLDSLWSFQTRKTEGFYCCACWRSVS